MDIQANQPVSPLSVMARTQQYERARQGMRNATGDSSSKAGISQYTINRVVQETTEAAIRNLGSVVV